MRRLRFTRRATRDLARLPDKAASNIVLKLEKMAADPTSQANNIRALAGFEGFRLRVGDWRILFTQDDNDIVVHVVGHRSSVYRDI